MSFESLGIVIPSINESKNLSILLTDIFDKYPKVSVVVVDDSSLEEQQRLNILQKQYQKQNLEVLFRGKKDGRGSAVLEGMRILVKNKKIQSFIEMDADLAHDPKEITRLLGKRDQADLVIGSRYMGNSKIVKWPVKRLVQSKIINFFLRFWLGLKITDYTNGFRLYSRNAVTILLKHTLHEKGYIALSEMAYTLQQAGCKIAEVPITFTERKYGQSNADMKELFRSFIGAFRIRLRERN